MSVSILSTIVLLSGSFVACNPLTGALLKRSAQPGIALNAGWDGSSYKCAPGSNPTRFDKYCCPNGYELNTDINSFTSFLCCPIGTNCRDDVLQCPRCADTEWTYWDINGTNVPPTLPFCCQSGWGPGQLNEPDPANVCTTGGNRWTDYLTASQCGAAADATGAASTATATAAGSGTAATTTASKGSASSTNGAPRTSATASSTSSAASGNGASASVWFSGSSSFALLMVMLLPGVLLVMI